MFDGIFQHRSITYIHLNRVSLQLPRWEKAGWTSAADQESCGSLWKEIRRSPPAFRNGPRRTWAAAQHIRQLQRFQVLFSVIFSSFEITALSSKGFLSLFPRNCPMYQVSQRFPQPVRIPERFCSPQWHFHLSGPFPEAYCGFLVKVGRRHHHANGLKMFRNTVDLIEPAPFPDSPRFYRKGRPDSYL